VEINGYRLGRKIAETELCSVHNAIDLATSKTVSVRIFHHKLSRHPGFCTGFSHFAGSVQGERVGAMVTLLQYGADEQACYAVTDYFPCLPLLQTQPVQMPAKAVLQGGIEIAATLELLHGRGLVHGALRPGNLFFNDQLKLTLGLGINRPEGPSARPLPVDTAAAALYLPPEGGNEAAADWYALGVCLYQQLTGQPPFDSTDLERQLKQKHQGLLLMPGNGHQSLLPLFQSLLHPDPERRTGSTDAFWDQADAGGYRLLRPRFAAEPTGETAQASEPAAAPISSTAPPKKHPPGSRPEAGDSEHEPASRRPMIIGIVAVVIAGIAALVLLWPRAPDTPVAGSDSPPAAATPSPAPVIPTPAPKAAAAEAGATTTLVAEPPLPDELPEDEQRFLLARSLFAEGRPGQALMSVNEALRINPQNRDAARLRQSILDELEIRSILKRAEEQLLAGRLSTPPGDNALESYRSLAALLPKGDPRMQRGLSRIANRFLELSRKAVAQRRLDDARQLADSGARLFPGFTPLQALKEDIDRQIEQRRVAEQKRRQEARKQEQIRKIEQARQQKRQQLASKRRQLENRFKRALAANTPLQTGVDQATAAYQELVQLKTPASQLQPMRKQLVAARIRLAEQQMAQGQFEAANQTLQQGLRLGDDSGALQRQINRLQQAIEQRQQQQHADNLLAEARILIESASASTVDLDRAAQLIGQVATFAGSDPRIGELKTQLLRASDRQAAAAIEAGRLDDAARYIDLGLAQSPDDSGLLARRQQLEDARNRARRRSVPVIGTF
jgi:serine/threonine protein kinase